jgi:hypothetical protein
MTNNGIIVMTQHHPYGLLMIQDMVKKINDRLYYDPNYKNKDGRSVVSNLNITGPDAIKNLFRQQDQLTWYNMRCFMEKN